MILNKLNELGISGTTKVFVGNTLEEVLKIKQVLQNYYAFLNKKDKKNKENILGLDFEFNTKKVALAQLYLENYPSPENDFILVFDPKDKNLEENFRQVLLSDNLHVILHGGESLDIPYLFNELFIKKKDIVKFTSHLIDTKYLCEFNLIQNPNPDYKCKLYHLMVQQKVFDKKKFEELEKNEEKMGKIWEIYVDVKKLTPEFLKYSVYDVLFLPKLIRNLNYSSSENKIITLLVQLNFLWKYNLIPSINSQKEIIEKISNSFYQNYRLNEVFSFLIVNLDNKFISQIKEINFIRKFVEQLQKIFLYPKILNKFTFYYSANNPVLVQEINDKIDLPKEILKLIQDNLNF